MKWKILFSLIIVHIYNSNTFADQPHSDCVKWFKKGKIDLGENCELDCTVLITDMSTFTCPSQCELLCKKQSPNLLKKFVYYPGLTPSEQKLSENKPKDALIVFIQKTRAEWSSNRNFPEQTANDEADAFRHFIWAGLLRKKLGPETAQLFLDAHEEDPKQPAKEKAMDLHNNQEGILASNSLIQNKKWSLKELEKVGLNALRTKRLKVLNPGLKIPRKPK